MKIRYRLDAEPEERVIELATFQEYEAWLWDLGAGGQWEDKMRRAWWAESWAKLSKGEVLEPFVIARSRMPELGHTVTIVGRE